ncbi:Thioredoxin [compost metagenome]
MSKKISILVLFLFILGTWLKAQEKEFVQSGYTSLTIKFSGSFPKEKKISIASYGTLLSSLKPIEFETVNDSTLFISFYAFGVSRCIFHFNNSYQLAFLLPNHDDILKIHYIDSINYSMDYKGYFKNIFDSSQEIYSIIKSQFSSGYFMVQGTMDYKTPEEYKNDVLFRIGKMTEEFSKGVKSQIVSDFLKTSAELDYKKMMLFDEYPQTFISYTRGKQLKSSEKLDSITKRDLSYYQGIVTSQFADTSRLIVTHYDLLNKINQDTLLKLPRIGKYGIRPYVFRLKQVFANLFPKDHNLFYDMMVATAYISEIEDGSVLTAESKLSILEYFKNKNISNYILHIDAIAKSRGDVAQKVYYLPFQEKKASVMSDILSRYKNKVIVIDFWATWCGPCIEAFDKIKEVKDKYSENNDVIFLYITDKSSDKSKWEEYNKIIPGEHYYLYNNQIQNIQQQFGIKTIPSYLIFNKKGELSNKSLGGYMGNNKLEEWIEKALID